MAHFAEINENNIVTRVLVVDNSLEHRGQDFLADDVGLGGRWVQTSYNANFRNKYAAIGDVYEEARDVFYSQQPFPSWTQGEDYIWYPPTPEPDDGNIYDWDEDAQRWVIALNFAHPEITQ
jgi:hypothetical protein